MIASDYNKDGMPIYHMEADGTNNSFMHSFAPILATIDTKAGYKSRNRDRLYPCISFIKGDNDKPFVRITFEKAHDVIKDMYSHIRERVGKFMNDEYKRVKPVHDNALASLAGDRPGLVLG